MADSGKSNTPTTATSNISTMSTGFRNERSGSTSSTGSGSTAGPSSPTSPRRASHGGLFEGLTAQKRKDDPASIARRQSMNEQRPKVGIIGQMWNNWVYGTDSKK